MVDFEMLTNLANEIARVFNMDTEYAQALVCPCVPCSLQGWTVYLRISLDNARGMATLVADRKNEYGNWALNGPIICVERLAPETYPLAIKLEGEHWIDY